MPTKKKSVKTYLSPDEHERLAAQARRAGRPLSTFIKRVCLGWEVHSLVDQEALLALLKSKADLGRLGGASETAPGRTGPDGKPAGRIERCIESH